MLLAKLDNGKRFSARFCRQSMQPLHNVHLPSIMLHLLFRFKTLIYCRLLQSGEFDIDAEVAGRTRYIMVYDDPPLTRILPDDGSLGAVSAGG